jgi:glucosylceramidase
MKLNFIFSIFVCFSITFVVIDCRHECVGRKGKNTQYCVCNATYCDDLDPITKQPKGTVLSFQTSQSGDRFKETKHTFTTKSNQDHIVLTLDKSKKFQKIFGIGAAFTDAATINIGSLPKDMTERLVKDYFSPSGIEFSMARIPIAGCDFSTRTYTYDDVKDDFELKQFNLTKEDFDYKIPQIKLAIKVAQHGLKLYGSPWVTPSWLNDKAKLKTEGDKHYQTWANYFVKFLDAYKQHGIELWGLTMQNEPMSFSSMNFLNASVERDFVKKHLGPALAKAGYGKDKLNLMVYDDGSDKNPMVEYVDTCLNDPDAAKYINGIAYHCYLAKNGEAVDAVHKKHPNPFILMTECCQNFRKNTDPFTPSTLGDWDHARDYASNVMNTLYHWVSGWVEWNLALDTFGHPNRDLKMADAPLLIDAKAKEYYKNPNFYVLGHYSKFITPDSVRVEVNASKTQGDFNYIAFERPDNSVVVIVYNLSNTPIDFVITDPANGSIAAKIPENSIQSYVYWN